MVEIDYIDVGYDDNLPEFDKGYNLTTKSENSVIARIEILSREEDVLQGGFQITYPRYVFSSKAKKHFNKLNNIAHEHYGEGFPMNSEGVEILNYGNENSICYISFIKIKNVDAVTFKVGNKIFW
ncbi:MAG: hypothetical protein IID16_06895 [Candidatus Marinimicrobia bacterium]|nr:hypothetical protein [Candidatus Neomarinimicrobiota bacterium]